MGLQRRIELDQVLGCERDKDQDLVRVSVRDKFRMELLVAGLRAESDEIQVDPI